MKALDQKNSSSTMRLCAFITSILSFVLGLSIAFHIVWCTVTNDKVEWQDMGYSLGGIAAITTGALSAKAYQRKQEGK